MYVSSNKLKMAYALTLKAENEFVRVRGGKNCLVFSCYSKFRNFCRGN